MSEITTYEQAVATAREYLGNGGLFNPELMGPYAVRDMVLDLLAVLEREHEDAERYRWLFRHDDGMKSRVERVWSEWYGGSGSWDEAVDAARKGEQS